MPKKGRKKAVKKSFLRTEVDENVAPIESGTMQFKERQRAFNNREVERRTAATKANCEVETGSLLSWVRLLPLYFSKDQLDTPAIQFFQENMPNATLTMNKKYNIFELQWNNNEIYYEGGKYDRASVSNIFTMPSMSDIQFSIDPAKKTLGAGNQRMSNFSLEMGLMKMLVEIIGTSYVKFGFALAGQKPVELQDDLETSSRVF
ncbi:hypothetical protein ZIOFF_052265 [Zingiber officinale]|uniref:Uncharacterized protein n=1 Tax=Zingiber officinale TaxID=94328 RepID=A0A8J5FN84_ZINOF|nr:hypothetical protein ZIOFF_052265 [Zingiber officinale]